MASLAAVAALHLLRKSYEVITDHGMFIECWNTIKSLTLEFDQGKK
jgi:hypothetical protein